MANTITYDEGVKGWTSFHSFIPDWAQKLNNRLFTTKGGQLYLHNDEDNSLRNNFYGVQYPTTIKAIVNDFPSEIKFAKTIKIEGNKPFDVSIKSYISDETTFVTRTNITKDLFTEKEGLFHAFFRRNEISSDLTAKNVYGIGRVDTVDGSVITMLTDIPTASIAIGDTLLNEAQVEIGIIQNYSGKDIIVDTTPIIATNTFLVGTKDTRIEGSEIRGYNFEVDLIDDSATRTEIFAFNIGLSKSHPS
tara:strand:+ start:11110 stop:11853 length:744 start_codon:yes stop_codon:yes gene_type:complete